MVLCRLDDVLLERASVCIGAVIAGQRDGRTVSLAVLNNLSPSRLATEPRRWERWGVLVSSFWWSGRVVSLSSSWRSRRGVVSV